jgi:hypothetical protein
MRHQVPDLQTQQQQQQSFLAAIHQQTAMFKEVHKTSGTLPTTTMIKTEDMSLVEPTIITKSQNSINNCIISMNSNGQYQIKPRIIMKEPVKGTMSPLIFPTTSSSTGQIGNSNSSIQSEHIQKSIICISIIRIYIYSSWPLFASTDVE